MFRRSLASSPSPLLRSSSSSLLRSVVVARPASLMSCSTLTLPSRAASLFRPTCSGSIRCKSSTPYELPKEGKLTAVKDLRRDWAEKGPVAFEEMREISKRAASSTDVMILDVRELAEIQQGNIPSSLPLPLSILEDSLKLGFKEWEESLGFRKPGRDQPIVVYCRSGKRSQSAMDKLTGEGPVEDRFTNVRNYTGSWNDWSEKYKPSQEEEEDD